MFLLNFYREKKGRRDGGKEGGREETSIGCLPYVSPTGYEPWRKSKLPPLSVRDKRQPNEAASIF